MVIPAMIKARITEIQVMTGTAATTTKKRHEYKYKIASSEAISLISRFDALLKPDKHGQDGSYYVNSLYFDNHEDIALKAKVDGVVLDSAHSPSFHNLYSRHYPGRNQ